MRDLRKYLKVFSVNAIIFFALIEILSIGAYFFYKGGFFYTASRNQEELHRNNPMNLVFHPYFGYARRWEPQEISQAWLNQDGFGFINNYVGDGRSIEYPFEPQDDEYVIGIFGGSFAQEFFHHREKFQTLENELKKSPMFGGKALVILEFAFAGYKQPQQMAIFSYYQMMGQHLDLALVLDGFNEVAHGATNFSKGVPISVPVDEIWGSMARFVEGQNVMSASGYGAKAQWHKWAAVDARRTAEGKCDFAACYYWFQAISIWHNRQSEAAFARGEKVADDYNVRSHFVTRKGHDAKASEHIWPVPESVFDEIARQWAGSLRVMTDLARPRDTTVVGILQPNLYFPRGRVFPQLDPSNNPFERYIDLVERGYPALINQIETLQADGVVAIDGTSALDGAAGGSKELLKDDCCHLTDEGYRHMSLFAAKEIVRATAN
ncbi:MAG: SGNH/GDSL hydrolase family protein [Rhodospirillales bacterium]|nr:SGNH/GDSL hydrolase family protein [Rhodospirillales bacterium]